MNSKSRDWELALIVALVPVVNDRVMFPRPEAAAAIPTEPNTALESRTCPPT